MRASIRISVLVGLGLAGALILLLAPGGQRPGAARAQAGPTTAIRTYYIAADEVNWDYAPTGRNQITGKPFTDDENVFVGNGPNRIGSKYKKALYRQYTDATFTKLAPRDPRFDHTGFLGPTIRAEVGDTIKVIFRNNGSFPYSMHPHGVRYTKSSEGAP